MGSAPESSSKLFEPLQLGNMQLSSRIAMAPLGRFRCSDDNVIMKMAEEYFGQRACIPGTFLVTEATVISHRAGNYRNVAGIYNQKQIEAYKGIAKRVHDQGSYIYMQLWALGRVADPEVKKEEHSGDVVSSSAIPHEEGAPVPRELTNEEIEQYIQDYANAAKNAIEAGFDGVEIHGANGYLIDQFMQDTCNKRTDKWGGSVENRARFGLEVVKAVCQAIGSKNVGIRLSPFSDFQGMKMKDPIPQFTYLTQQLKTLNLAYMHLVEARISGNEDFADAAEKIDPFIQAYDNASPILLAGGFKPDTARKAVDEDYKDYDMVIVFGRHFIANPDLVYRIRNGISLTKYDRDTFYKVRSPDGYIDYPFSEEYKKDVKQ